MCCAWIAQRPHLCPHAQRIPAQPGAVRVPSVSRPPRLRAVGAGRCAGGGESPPRPKLAATKWAFSILEGSSLIVWGRFITYRSGRASKDHHCIFGLQTSSHSPGPRCPMNGLKTA